MADDKPQNPVSPEMRAMAVVSASIASSVLIHYRRLRKRGYGPERAIEAAFGLVDYPKVMSTELMAGVEATLYKTASIKIGDPIGFRKWYLNRHWRGQDFSISNWIHHVNRQTLSEIKRAIRVRMRASKSWQSVARGITSVGADRGKLPGYITDLVRSSRRALSGDPAAIADYRRTAKAAQRQIDRLITSNASSERLKKAYQNLINKTVSIDKAQLEKAVDRATRAKINYNSTRISRTELARAYGVGQGEQIESDPDAAGVRWLLSSAHKVYDICDINQGIYPKNQVPSYPAHPQCCLPGSVVQVPGRILRFYDAFYEGPCVEVTLSGGKSFSVTTNHPICSTRGIISAESLCEGDDVFSSTDVERIASTIYPDNDSAPTLIEKIPESFDVPSEVSTAAVPTAREYLHGDGEFIQGDINIVNSDRLLLGNVTDSGLPEEVDHNVLSGGDPRTSGLSTGSSISKRSSSLFGTSNSSMSSGIDLSPFNGVGSGSPRQLLSSMVTPGGDTGFEQTTAEDPSTNPNLFREFLLRFSRYIAVEEVLKIRYFNYSGHVYNLQSDPYQIYTCNGVFVHNCTCILEPVYRKSKHTKKLEDPKKKLQNVSEKQRATLLGKRGAAAFKRDPDSYRQHLRNKPTYRSLTGSDSIPKRFIQKPED